MCIRDRYSADEGKSELYNLAEDFTQTNNIIAENIDTARDIHGHLLKFMKDTNVPAYLQKPREQLKI